MKKTLVAVACMGVIGMANAAHDGTEHAYIGIQGGVARLNDKGNQGMSDAGVGRLYAGYAFHPNMAFEVGTLATSDFTGYGGRVAGSVTGVDAAIVAKHDSGVYMKLGGYTGSMTGHAGPYRISQQQSNGLFGVGYEHAFSNNISGDIGITRYHKAFDTVTLGVKYKF